MNGMIVLSSPHHSLSCTFFLILILLHRYLLLGLFPFKCWEKTCNIRKSPVLPIDQIILHCVCMWHFYSSVNEHVELLCFKHYDLFSIKYEYVNYLCGGLALVPYSGLAGSHDSSSTFSFLKNFCSHGGWTGVYSSFPASSVLSWW